MGRKGKIKKGAGEVLAGSGRRRGRREGVSGGSRVDFLKGSWWEKIISSKGKEGRKYKRKSEEEAWTG